MHVHNRFTYAALGLVFGLGIALFFLAWAVPEFRYSADSQISGINSTQEKVSRKTEKPNKQPEGMYWAERFVSLEDTIAQWIMALFSIVAAGASIYAVLLLRDTLAETRIANANASGGVEAAKLSIGMQQLTSIRELRAYICVHSAELLEPEDRVGFSARIVFTNFGQTPAHSVSIRCREQTIRPEAIAASMALLDDAPKTEPVVIGPTASFSKSIYNILEKDELTAIQKEEFVIWVFGDVKYKDAFGEAHVTTFCLRVWRFGQPSARIGPCEFGNTAT